MNLAEKYRPRSWDQVIGQDKAVKQARHLCARGLGGRAVWISGKSGTGKTTIARLMVAEFADSWAVDELSADGFKLPDLAALERSYLSYRPMGSRGRAIVLNEAHRAKDGIVGELLNVLERLPDYVCWIFTTTTDGQALFEDHADSAPFLSRCNRIELAQRDLCRPFAERGREIALAEGLDGQDVAKYERALKDRGNNFRALLMLIDSGEMLA